MTIPIALLVPTLAGSEPPPNDAAYIELESGGEYLLQEDFSYIKLESAVP